MESMRFDDLAMTRDDATLAASRARDRGPTAMASTVPLPSGQLRPERAREFARLRQVYCLHGGLLSGDEVAQLMRTRHPQPTSVLARLIVDRKVVNVTFEALILIPLFQFTPQWSVHPNVIAAVGELAHVKGDWGIAEWFTEKNTSLNDSRPIDLVASSGAAVIQAARAERSIARGC